MQIIDRAREFFQENGRDIDRARFNYHFGRLPLEALLEVLARYQNQDGGFFGLEVDIAAPVSNPFATELALLICLQAEVPRDHPLLRRTAAYLEQTQDESGGWRFTPEVYEHDLAPWFQGWQWPNLNPACTLAGMLKALGLGSDTLHDGVERLFQQLATADDLVSEGFYDVRPCAHYFLPEWFHPERDFYLSGVLWWLIRQHVAGEVEDGAHFFDYVRRPQTYTGKRLPKAILNERLDMLAAEQVEDGGWPTPYDEGWRGWVTMQNLLVLSAFGRL